jgi:PhnB protein
VPNATITPYLFFGGRCDEALAFYREALGAEVEVLIRHDENPVPPPPGVLAPGFEKKVMHASFRVRGALLMASDGRDHRSKSEGCHLSLALPTEADARRVYDSLAAGGTAEVPPGRTFWSPCFGMLTDRFGIGWMVTVAAA